VALKGSVAKRYAKALLLIAQEKNLVREIGEDLKKVSVFFDGNQELFTQLLSPALNLSDREKFLDSMSAAMGLRPETANFFHLLNRKVRLEHLKRIQESYQTLSDQASGLVRAEVSSAHTLPEDLRRRLIGTLEKRTQKKVMAEFKIDSGLIGGIKVQIGSTLLDGSIAAQLKRMEEDLKKI
jgi:F-type H+-transporting ATPase subunit delta